MSFFKNLFSRSKKKSQEPSIQSSSIISQEIKNTQNSAIQNKGLEKYFLKCSLSKQSSERISAEDLKYFRSQFEGDNQEEIIIQFFNIVEKSKLDIICKLKVLTAFHKLIIELGENFAVEFLQYKFTSLIAQPYSNIKSIKSLGQINDQDSYLYDNILSQYFNYLLRMANNYQIYKICTKEGKLPQTDDSKLDYKLKFMWLFKLSNLFSYLLQMHKSLTKIFREMCSLIMMKDIGLLILNDCLSYYNVMSKEMSEFVQCYHLLTTFDSIQFYQVYCELKSLTLDLRIFFNQKQIFDDHDRIHQPQWFDVPQNTDKDIEIYAKKMELLNSSAVGMRRILKSGVDIRQQQINFTESGNLHIGERNRTKSATTNGSGKKINDGRVRTESAIYGRDERDYDEDICRLDNDEILAIQKFEEMLKEQQTIQRKLDNRFHDHLEEEDEMEEETNRIKITTEAEAEAEIEAKAEEAKVEAEAEGESDDAKEQFALNQEIIFSPGKPITFRCQVKKDKEKVQPMIINSGKTEKEDKQIKQEQNEQQTLEQGNDQINQDQQEKQLKVANPNDEQLNINNIQSCESLDDNDEQKSTKEIEKEQKQEEQKIQKIEEGNVQIDQEQGDTDEFKQAINNQNQNGSQQNKDNEDFQSNLNSIQNLETKQKTSFDKDDQIEQNKQRQKIEEITSINENQLKRSQ